ncbi:hypothetical protein EDD76_108204 [Kineothrix alysoides]|uniref:Uncharacterized protein n=1 Tax=Kineothrix alysoides TaxID=1469948 RepID=A0A4R1QUL9_9FIRM|nr:hypothetical protein [Kineothrix alysoides]TCL57669.1 hypothetical protein EDD76_108204 [Kineothrix alysoides]
MQPQGGTIWGNINLCVEIALNIYYIWGENGEGIVIPKEHAEANFSDKTVAAGKESEGNLYYKKGDTMDMPLYEILQKRAAMARKMEITTANQMDTIRKSGQEMVSDFFQTMEPPKQEAAQVKAVREGIYMVYGKEAQIAIHEQIAEYFLSPYACEFGKNQDGYFYYSLQAGAVPLNELKEIFPECRQMLVSEESLYATICQYYPTYREGYNGIVGKDEQIPKIKAPLNLFLQEQLNQEPDNEGKKDVIEQEREEKYEEEDYGEQVDYGFER